MDFGIREPLILVMAAVIVWPYCRVLAPSSHPGWACSCLCDRQHYRALALRLREMAGAPSADLAAMVLC